MKDITKQSIQRYVQLGRRPGDFLMAVLSNDLMDAMGRADMDNRFAMFDICSYIHNSTPLICHGSREIVEEWIRRGGLAGIRKEERLEQTA
jgi:hypothetical protein